MSLIDRLSSRAPVSDSILAAGASLTGTLRGKGRMVIEGHLEGDAVAGTVVVAAGGRVDGDISADTLTISGTVTGSVQVSHLVVAEGGSFSGEAFYESIEVAEGADLNARCRVMPKPAAATASSGAKTARPAALPVPLAGKTALAGT